MVREAVVLRRVEDLEERRRRVPLHGDAELVDFVEEEDRVLRPGLPHPLDDPPRHRADVGPPVATDVGLVARSAERDPHVLAAEGARDRLRDRGLSDAGRTGEKEDPAPVRGALSFGRLRPRVLRRFRLRTVCGLRRRRRSRFRRLASEQLADREELEDPVLHVLQGVVVLVQDPLRLHDVEVLLAPRRPGKLGDELEVVAKHLRLHRLAGETLELLPLPVDLLADVLGQDESLELLLEPLQVVVPVLALAQLLLNRLQLLAEEHLPLPVAQLLLDLRLDLFLRVEDVDLPLDVDRASAARGPRPRASRGGAAARPSGCRCTRRRGRRAGPGRRPRRGRSRRPRRGGRASWPARPTAPSAPSGVRRRRCWRRRAEASPRLPRRPLPAGRPSPGFAWRCRAPSPGGGGAPRRPRAGSVRWRRSSRRCGGARE